MATLAEIYNKVASAEDFAQSTPNQRAATLLNNYNQMVSPEYARNTDQAIHAVEDAGNIIDPAISAGSAFVNAVGSLPVIENVAKPLAQGIDSLHSDSYDVHQIAKQAHRDVFDRNNQAQYYSDLANGKSSTMASLAKVGREAMDYFSNSNGQDLITDIGSGAGSLAGSFALGGAIGKAVGAVYTGIKAARLASTVEGRLAGYQSALTQAQNVRAQLMTKLSDAGITNTEKEALATELGNLNKVIDEATTEQQALVQQANLARNNLAAAETQRDLYSSTSPLKNDSLIERKFNNGTLLSDEALAKNVNYNKQSVAEATDALRANKSVLDSNQSKANTIQEYLNQEKKIQSSEKGINKLNKFHKDKLAQIEKKAQEISPELGGLATNFAFGLSEGKEALSELDNLTVEDFKANATEQAKQEFNSLVKDNLADGMNQEKAEAEALDSLKSKAKFTNMVKTGLAEAAISKVFGTAKLEGLGLKKGLAGGLLRTAANTLKETSEELGQTYAENSFGNKAIQYFNRNKDTTENLGRDLAQTAVSIPGGMGTAKAVKVGSDVAKAGFIAGKAIAHEFTESNTAKRVTNTVKAMDTGSAKDLSNIDKATKELLTPTPEIKANLKEGLSNLASQFEADEDIHTTLDNFAKGVDSDTTLVDTTNRLSKAIDDSVATVQSTKASDEEVQQALTDIKHLYYAIQAVHKTIENSGSTKDKPFTTKVAQANTKRLLNKLEPVMDKILPIATEQMNKYVEDKEVAKENIENYKMHLNLVKDLINSKTSDKDLAKLDSAISKLNPSYATLPITEELKNKLELAKAFQEVIKQHSDNLDSISDNSHSTARQSKILEGSDRDSLKDYLNTISDLLDSNDVSDKQLAKVSNQLQHFINTQTIKADYLSLALNQLEADSKLSTEEFNKKYNNPVELTASDKFKELEKHLDSSAEIAIDKENNFITISGLSAGHNLVPFQFKVRMSEHGYSGTKQAKYKSGNIQQSRALLQDIIAENNEISWLAESVNKFLNKEYSVSPEVKDTHKKTVQYRQVQQVNQVAKYNAVREKSLSDLNNLFGSNNIIKEESIDIDAPVKYKLKNTNAKIAVASSIDYVTNPDTGVTQHKVGPVIKADLQLKSSFIYSNGSRKGTPDYDTQTSINALKALQLVSEYLKTFSIADEKERLNAQKEIFDRYPKKSNGKPVAFKLANLFTPESITKAAQDAYPNNPQEQQKLLDFWVNNPKGFAILPPKAIEKNSTVGKIYNFPLAILFLNRALSDNKDAIDSNGVQNANDNDSNFSVSNPIGSAVNANTAKIDTKSTEPKSEPYQTDLFEESNITEPTQEPKTEENKSENINDADLLSGNISEEFHDDLLDAFDADDLLPKGTTQSVSIKDVEDIKDEQDQTQIDNTKINELVNESVQSLEEAVNALNAINNEGFKFTESIVDSEVIDKVLQLDTSSLLVQNIDSVIDQIALDVARHVQTHLDSYKANARSLGLYRFFNFSVNNGQVVATWRMPKEHIRSAILLGYATASTKASSISSIVKGSLEAFTSENDLYADTTLSDTEYTVEGNKDKLNYSQLVNTFKNTNNLFVSVDALGSSLVSAFKSVFPSITSDELTYLGSKGAYDILATDFLTALNLSNTNTITRVTGQAQLEESAIAKKFLNIMSLPPVFVNSKTMQDMFPRINDLNKAIAKASRTIPDMFIGTKEEAKELTESFESKNTIKGTNAIINKAQKEANKVAKTIPHNVNNYGKLVSNIRKQDYIDALHPYENYVSEDAREAEDSIIRQINDSFDELINIRITLSKQPESSIYYNNNYTVANRLNSEHYQSYRNSKTIREAITPELSSTPISEKLLNDNPALRKLWYRALMQGIGDKVQNQQDEEIANNLNKLKELITSKLGSENIQALAQYFDITNTANLTLDQRKHLGAIYKDLAQILRDNYGGANEVALHNAVELIRYMAKPDVEFNSTIYGEADGITNGIFFSKLINAVYMAGLLKQGDEKFINELANLARVGFALGIVDKGFYKDTLDSLNKEIKEPNVHPLILDNKVQDIYTTVAYQLSADLSKPINTNKPDEVDRKLLIGLLVPYLEYSSYDIQSDTVKLSRNSVKKPVTQVNYSAGEKSIANSFADQIFTEINKLLGKNGKSNLGLFNSPEIVNIKKYLYSALVHAFKTKSMSDLDIQNAVANFINQNPRIAPALKSEFMNNPDVYKALKLQVVLDLARRFKITREGFVNWSDTYTKKEKGNVVTKDTLDITYEFNSKTNSVNDKYFKYNLSQFIKHYVISPLMDKIEGTMGESKNDIPSISTSAAAYTMLSVHNDHLNQELAKEIQKVIPSYKANDLDETLLYAERVLPRRTVKEIKQRVEKEYPVKLYTKSPELDGTLTPYTLFAYKTDSTNINSEYGKATKETLTIPQGQEVVHFANLSRKYVEAGVAPRPLGNISAGDAATMVSALNEVAGKHNIPFQDIFDGLNFSSNNYLNPVNPNKIINEIAVTKALGTNNLKPFYKNLVKLYEKNPELAKEYYYQYCENYKTNDNGDVLIDFDLFLKNMGTEVQKIDLGHRILSSGLVPFTSDQYAFAPEGYYAKQAKLKVFNPDNHSVDTYTIMDTIPVKILPEYLRLVGGIVNRKYSKTKEVYEKYEDKESPEFKQALKEIKQDYYADQETLLNFLQDNGVTVAISQNDLAKVQPKPKAKPKKKKVIDNLSEYFKSAKEVYKSNTAYIAGSEISDSLLDNLLANTQVAVFTTKELTNLLHNNDIKEISYEDGLFLLDVANQLDMQPDNAATVFIGNKAFIIGNKKPKGKVLNHELIHSMFKAKLANIFNKYPSLKLTSNNGKYKFTYEESLTPEVKDFIIRLQQELNRYATDLNYAEDNRKVIDSYIGYFKDSESYELIDELITQVIEPASLKVSNSNRVKSNLLTLLKNLLKNFTLDNLKELFKYFSVNRHVRLHGLSNLVLLSNSVESVEIKNASYALKPTTEVLKKVLETKPQKFHRLTKAFSYNEPNKVTNIYEFNWLDDLYNKQITKEQAVEWALYDDIVTNKAMSDKQMLDLNKLYTHLLKSEQFKNLSDDIQKLLYGQAASDYLGNKSLTHPLANFMFLAVNSEPVKEALKNINIPKLSFGSFNYKADQITADLVAKTYNNFIKDATVSSKYDHLLAKICSDDSIFDALSSASDNLSNFENKANNVINTCISTALNKVAKNVVNFAPKGSTVRELAKTAGIVTSMELHNINAVDAVVTGASLVNQFYKLPNAISHLVDDISGVTSQNYEPLALFKKSKAHLDKMTNRLAKEIPLEIKNKFRNISPEQERLLITIFLRADVSCLVSSGSNVKDLIEILADNKQCYQSAIQIRESVGLNKNQWKKIEQLANYLATGKTGGRGLLQNAYVISKLTDKGNLDLSLDNAKLENLIDQAITYLTLSKMQSSDLGKLSDLCAQNYEGMKDFIDLHIAIKNRNLAKLSNKLNYHKGYLPRVYSNQVSIDIATSLEQVKELKSKGWEVVKEITPSNSYVRQGNHNLYLMRCALPSVSFRQGLIKPNRLSLFGVNESGFASNGIYKISPKNYDSSLDTATDFNPIPVFNSKGAIIGYDLNFDQYIEQSGIRTSDDPFQLLGIWNSQDYIAQTAKGYNDTIATLAANMYQQDLKQKGKEFVNHAYLPISELTKKDRVTASAWALVPSYVKKLMANKQNCTVGDILLRKDMVDLFLGYHQASVTDIWTGRTRWNPNVCNYAAKLAKTILGEDAYKKLASVERTISYTTSFARNAIVVRSVAVPFTNLTANILQLRMRGIPFSYISKEILNKVSELEHYNTLSKNMLKLETKLATLKEPSSPEGKRLQSKIDSIKASIDVLSIAPMINAGELSTINDVGDDYNSSLFTGHWAEKIEEYVNKLPESVVQFGKYIMVSKDTGLYQLMEKATIYGDFVSKSIYYDWLLKNGEDVTKATMKAMNEFVNYDMLAGRNREYLENMGVLWFYNYKLRILRTMADIALHNPVSALLAMYIAPEFIAKNNVFADSFLGKLIDGKLGGTFLNPAMLEAPITKNPIVELMSL